MNWPDTCAAIIPCLDEAATIATVVRRAQTCLPQVIVVDDGSTDATATRATTAGARVLRHPQNLGKGAALRTGLTAACEAGFVWGVTLDADGQHPPERIPAFLKCVEDTHAELVVGDRFAHRGSMPLLRRLVNGWMSRQLSRRSGTHLPDTQCGFRLLRLSRWASLSLKADHFEVESEMLLAFLEAGARVRFVPVPALAAPRPSHLRPATDAWRWLRWWRLVNAQRSVANGARARTCAP